MPSINKQFPTGSVSTTWLFLLSFLGIVFSALACWNLAFGVTVENVRIDQVDPLEKEDLYSVSYVVKNMNKEAVIIEIKSEVGADVISGYGRTGRKSTTFQPLESVRETVELEPSSSLERILRIRVAHERYLWAIGSRSPIKPRVVIERVSR